ncbi:unnamed protein product, partial [Strongylus vulgaris]
ETEHVGEKRGAGKCRGNHGYGTCSEEGERILKLATVYDLALANNYYIEKDHLMTHSTEDRRTNRFLGDKAKRAQVCKNKPLTLDFKMPADSLRKRTGTNIRCIKWESKRENYGQGRTGKTLAQLHPPVMGRPADRSKVFRIKSEFVKLHGLKLNAKKQNLWRKILEPYAQSWMKWWSLTGILCDKRMPLHLTTLVCRSVIRPAAPYGSDVAEHAKRREQAWSWGLGCCGL